MVQAARGEGVNEVPRLVFLTFIFNLRSRLQVSLLHKWIIDRKKCTSSGGETLTGSENKGQLLESLGSLDSAYSLNYILTEVLHIFHCLSVIFRIGVVAFLRKIAT